LNKFKGINLHIYAYGPYSQTIVKLATTFLLQNKFEFISHKQ